MRTRFAETSTENEEASVVPPTATSSEVAVKYVTVPASVHLLPPAPPAQFPELKQMVPESSGIIIEREPVGSAIEMSVSFPSAVFPSSSNMLLNPVPNRIAVSVAVPPVKSANCNPYSVSASPEDEVSARLIAAFVSVASPSSA